MFIYFSLLFSSHEVTSKPNNISVGSDFIKEVVATHITFKNDPLKSRSNLEEDRQPMEGGLFWK